MKLSANRVNAVYDPDVSSIRYMIKMYGYSDTIKVFSVPGTRTGLYTVFTKMDHRHFLEKYEKAQRDASKKKSYAEILQGYLK